MAENPYSGQAGYEGYAEAWDWGYQYGHAYPYVADYQAEATKIDHWAHFTQEQQNWMRQTWAEGAAAGKADAAQPASQVVHSAPAAVQSGSHDAGTANQQTLTCQYPIIYVQEGASTPGAPYVLHEQDLTISDILDKGHLAGESAMLLKDGAVWTARRYGGWLVQMGLEAVEAAEADAAATALIHGGISLVVGAALFIAFDSEIVHHCGDVCPYCNSDAESVSGFDTGKVLPPHLCYQEYPHSSEHLCGENHTWTDTPIGINEAVRAGTI
jgi:hypothetical protein